MPQSPLIKREMKRIGAQLILGGARRVRVLTLPNHFGHRQLFQLWEDRFEPCCEDIEVWLPGDAEPPRLLVSAR